jgi:hypothetical protein
LRIGVINLVDVAPRIREYRLHHRCDGAAARDES